MCSACDRPPPEPADGASLAERDDGTRGGFRPGVAVARGLIGLYRLTLSPLLPNACRYQPSCSAYGIEAIERFGFWAGGWVLAARLARCHPLGASGFDPVPDRLPPAPWYAPWRYGRWTGRHIDPATRLD